MEVPDRNSSHTAYSFHPSWVRVWNRDLSGTAYPFLSCQVNYRITAWVRLEGTSWDHVVQPPYASKVCWSWLGRTASSQVFNKSTHRHFTTSLDNLLQWLITLTVNFFIIKDSRLIFKELNYVMCIPSLVTCLIPNRLASMPATESLLFLYI